MIKIGFVRRSFHYLCINYPFKSVIDSFYHEHTSLRGKKVLNSSQTFSHLDSENTPVPLPSESLLLVTKRIKGNLNIMLSYLGSRASNL